MCHEPMNQRGYARHVVVLSLWLLAACSIDVREAPGRDTSCPDVADAGCPDGKECNDVGACPGCKDSGTCKETGTCLKCGDSKPCIDLGKCAACPDHGPPDVTVKPDKAVLKSLVDDTFADFSKGTLSESGAKIYVAKKGNVQLLDRLDLDGDGWLDLVFCSFHSSTFSTNSFVYLGSSGGKYSKGKRKELPTVGATANALADLNQDGYPDIVFAQSINSLIYWGSAGGAFSSKNVTGLPTIGAIDVSVADLNRDGHLDIVFANHFDEFNKKPKVNSYVYWGSGTGYSPGDRTELATLHANGVSVADLNRDGLLDLVFSNSFDSPKKTSQVNSYIYWGKSGKMFSTKDRTELPSQGAWGNTVADIDGDGHLDIIFSNYYLWTVPTSSYQVNSYIYWGSSAGYSASRRHLLPTKGAVGVSAADLNKDGNLDIVFSNFIDGPNSYDLNSYIYWGTPGGKPSSAPSLLRNWGARGNLVADLNRDGYPDVVFINYSTSHIYWGASSGYSVNKRTPLPTSKAKTSTTTDPGSVYDRKPIQTFTSRVLDSGSASPAYAKLAWKAAVPKNTALKLQLRSAASPVGLMTAPWRGPTSGIDHYKVTGDSYSPVSKAHDGDRYVQYRATFSHDFGNTPVLDRVEVSYYP